MTRREIAVAAAGVSTFLNLYPTQALLPTLAREFGASLSRTGLTVTASLIAVAVVAPFVGTVSDALGRKRLIVGAALLLLVPTLACAAAPTLGTLVLARFLQGLLLPFIFTVTVAYIADECPGPEAVRATGVYTAGTIIGGFSGRFVAGWVAEYAGWRMGFVALGLLTLVGGVLVLLLLPVERRFRAVRSWRGSVAGFMDQFRNRQVMATCAIGFAVLFSLVATFTYANFLLAAPPYDMGPAQLGTVFVVYLLGTVTTPLAARLALRLGRRWTVVVAGAVAAAGLGLTLLPALAPIVVGIAMLAIGVFVEQSMSIGHVALSARQARSTAVGIYVTCYYVGGSLGGVLPAGLWAHLGWPGCVGLVLVVQAVAVTAAWLVWPRAPKVAAP